MPLPAPEASSQIPDGPVGKPTGDFVKFSFQDVREFEKTWTLEAGHHFVKDTDAQWDQAWCYTKYLVDGVSVQIDLARRLAPNAVPGALLATRETLKSAGLSDDDAILLATFCPWDDERKYATSDFELGRNLLADVSPQEPGASQAPPVEGAYVQFGSYVSQQAADGQLARYGATWSKYLRGARIAVQTVDFGQSQVRYNIRASYPTVEIAKSVCADVDAAGGVCFAGAY